LELQELSLALMLLLGAVNERIFQEHQIAPKLHLSQNQATEGLQRGLLTGVQLPWSPVKHADGTQCIAVFVD